MAEDRVLLVEHVSGLVANHDEEDNEAGKGDAEEEGKGGEDERHG